MVVSILAAYLAATIAVGPQTSAGVIVHYGDLDLATTRGARIFDDRVVAAARDQCSQGRWNFVNTVCLRQIKRQVVRALPARTQLDYLTASRTRDDGI